MRSPWSMIEDVPLGSSPAQTSFAILHKCRERCAMTSGSTSNGSPAIRIFLLDDHEVVRRGVRDLLELEDDLEVVGEAGSADEALVLIPAIRPDVAVLDVRLPDGDGV